MIVRLHSSFPNNQQSRNRSALGAFGSFLQKYQPIPPGDFLAVKCARDHFWPFRKLCQGPFNDNFQKKFSPYVNETNLPYVGCHNNFGDLYSKSDAELADLKSEWPGQSILDIKNMMFLPDEKGKPVPNNTFWEAVCFE